MSGAGSAFGAAALAIGLLGGSGGSQSVVRDGNKLTVKLGWQGRATGPGSPDLALLPPVPFGRLWYLQSARIANVNAAKQDYFQASAIYTKVFNNVPEAFTPNLDYPVFQSGIAPHIASLQTVVGAGGVKNPGDVDQFTPWSVPLPFTASVRSQFEGSIALGNSSSMELDFLDGGAATEFIFTGSRSAVGGFKIYSEAIPEGKRGIVCSAFINGTAPFNGTIETLKGETLVSRTLSSASGRQFKSSGGYSSKQASEFGQGGTALEWNDYISIPAGDNLEFKVETGSDGTIGWMVVVAIVDA